ncbi:hypothetical protein SAMN05660464_2707 [Geodermatophilus dictyosporus]|uniref:Membrane-associated oxidoreductase n=1 Tax=Geodermatophilus dictyosporus TaxID=1523247 RepID=A0A1I5PBD5_9ACTN|nr:hypothetical protein [Geodermatophilus dictyosporus]SFP30831.1 hypothetical protein SAMN05660464_2707 [Geodermatophilus dictyosporus]
MDLAPGMADEDIHPQGADSWPSERRIPAAAIREALLGRDLKPAPEGLVIRGADITGTLNLDYASVPFPLVINHSRFNRPLTARHACVKYLSLASSHLPGVRLDDSVIDSWVVLDESVVAGYVSAIQLRAGLFSATRMELKAEGGRALILDRANIQGSVYFDGLKSTQGELRLTSARIGGSLTIAYGTLRTVGKVILNLERAKVSGNVYLTELNARGRINLASAQLDGLLTWTGATIRAVDHEVKGLEDIAVYGQYLQVSTLWLRGIREVRGSLYLAAAQIGSLVVDPNPPDRQLPGPLMAIGCSIRDMHGIIREDRRAAASWLSSVDSKLSHITQPWHEFAAVYERIGQTSDARWMRWQAAKLTTRHAPWYTKLARWPYGALVGYGYYPLVAAAWLALTLIVTATLVAGSRASFAPTNPASAQLVQSSPPQNPGVAPEAPGPTVTGETACSEINPAYPCLDPILYAIDSLLPPGTAGQAGAWRVISTDWWSGSFAVLRTFAWITTALLLAGVTGLLRKT